MRKITITFILAAVVGVLGVSAASASASEFKAAEYPYTVSAASVNNGFQITGAVSVCKKATFKSTGSISGASETLEVAPEYKECEANIGGLKPATVNMNGCTYQFKAEAEIAAKLFKGSVSVKCETGKKIEVTVAGGLSCKIRVGSQTGLKEVEYKNEAGGIVKVSADVTGIQSSVESCPAGVKGSEEGGALGEYKEGNPTTGELTTNPVVANVEGFNTSLEPDALKVVA